MASKSRKLYFLTGRRDHWKGYREKVSTTVISCLSRSEPVPGGGASPFFPDCYFSPSRWGLDYGHTIFSLRKENFSREDQDRRVTTKKKKLDKRKERRSGKVRLCLSVKITCLFEIRVYSLKTVCLRHESSVKCSSQRTMIQEDRV